MWAMVLGQNIKTVRIQRPEEHVGNGGWDGRELITLGIKGMVTILHSNPKAIECFKKFK